MKTSQRNFPEEIPSFSTAHRIFWAIPTLFYSSTQSIYYIYISSRISIIRIFPFTPDMKLSSVTPWALQDSWARKPPSLCSSSRMTTESHRWPHCHRRKRTQTRPSYSGPAHRVTKPGLQVQGCMWRRGFHQRPDPAESETEIGRGEGRPDHAQSGERGPSFYLSIACTPDKNTPDKWIIQS